MLHVFAICINLGTEFIIKQITDQLLIVQRARLI